MFVSSAFFSRKTDASSTPFSREYGWKSSTKKPVITANDYVFKQSSGGHSINPTHEEISRGIHKVKNQEQDFVVLEKGDRFIQYGGGTVQHRIDDNTFMETKRYNLSNYEVGTLFLHFLEHPDQLDPSVDWEEVSL